jgi:small subunit ribosomal protein S1
MAADSSSDAASPGGTPVAEADSGAAAVAGPSEPPASPGPADVMATADNQPVASGPDATGPDATGPGSSLGSDSATAGDSPAPDAAAGDSPAPDAAAAGAAPAKKKRKRKRKRKAAGDPAAAAPRASTRPATERSPFHIGEEVFGRVTAVLDAAIMVDLAGKALAIFDRSEMEDDDLVPSVGDRFVASVLRDGSRGGLVVLSRKPMREEEAKGEMIAAVKSGALMTGLVTGVIKGGVDVSVKGLRAFAPASGMDLHPQNANFASLVGLALSFKVTQCDDKARDVVVTRRPMLEVEAHERRKNALGSLTDGQELEGTVRTIVEWGAFVALNDASGLEGLIHISEASHDPKAKITDLFKQGDKVQVKITKIDDRGKIWLSRKALLEDPWAEARSKFAVGKHLKATISGLEPFGAFVKLEDEIDGLIHMNDLTAAPQFGYKKVEHPKELLSVGDEIEVVIHHFDIKNRKVTLHVALPEDKRDEPFQKVARNASVNTEVVRAESSGLIVRLLGVTGRASRGFIPAGQTGTDRGTDLKKKFKVGTPLAAKVIDVDPRRQEPKLSIKQHAQDEERQAHRNYRKQLAKESGFGTLGDLLAAKLK